MTNLHKTIKNPTVKRRLAFEEGCLVDLRDSLPLLFKAYEDASLNYNEVVNKIPPNSRGRGFEASVFNTMLIQAIQSHFPDNWKFGKYKRFILQKDGYLILSKKLDNKGMPMNIKTKMVESINCQLMSSLFEESGYAEDPILYFGYKRDRLGNLHSPQLLYIDENQKKWFIDRSAVAGESFDFTKAITETKVLKRIATPRLKTTKKKAVNE